VCVVLILLVGAGVLTVGAGYAKDDDDAGEKCSEATLQGRYLFSYDGVRIERTGQVPFAVAGYQVFNGNGTQHGVSPGNVNGKIFRKEPFSGKYTVSTDCTGTTTTTDLAIKSATHGWNRRGREIGRPDLRPTRCLRGLRAIGGLVET
jgi:hypothetical protein